MAINPKNYAHNTAMEVHDIQRVYIDDYNLVKDELNAAGELYRSGQVDSAPVAREIKTLIKRKLAILEDINALGRIIDEKDGTLAMSQG